MAVGAATYRNDNGFFSLANRATSATAVPPPMCGGNVAAAAGSAANLVFDSSCFAAATIPPAFVWPEASYGGNGRTSDDRKMDVVPTIDMGQFRVNPDIVARQAAQAARDVGFFQLINHGVPLDLLRAAHEHMQSFFELPLATKQRANRAAGESFGYASSFTGRFSSRLPWKETFSLQPSPVSNVSSLFQKVLQDKHHGHSGVFEAYSAEMVRVGLQIVELLSRGLGLEQRALLRFFEEGNDITMREGNSSILRLNYYPPCQQPSLTFGTGPHTDPTGLTILHQDRVPGLQVFHNGEWVTVPPRPDALVINIGDTFTALTNGHYKSCLHRALVNKSDARRSIAFFFNPGFNTMLSPPKELIDERHPRAFRDFTWAKFLFFTQSVHRSGVNTLHTFNQWLATQS